MEIQDMRTMLTAEHECGSDVKLWLDKCYEQDGTTEHVCATDGVTDYWSVANKAGDMLHVVFGKTQREAHIHALRSRTVSKCKANEGDFALKRLTQAQYREFILTENDS